MIFIYWERACVHAFILDGKTWQGFQEMIVFGASSEGRQEKQK